MKNIDIYTDGACSHNPGPGGWAAVILYNHHQKEISGGEKNTTNNRMELTAVIEGLGILKEECNVSIYTDSAYIVNCFKQKWYVNWERNGWLTSTKKPVENKDLWEKLLNKTKLHNVTFIKVKGHSDVELNNLCDKMARAAVPR